MSQFQQASLYSRRFVRAEVKANTSRAWKRSERASKLVSVEGQHQSLLNSILASQKSNQWVVLVAAPDKQVVDWLVANGVDGGRLLQVHPTSDRQLMAAVMNGLASNHCCAVVGWTDLLDETQWQALISEAQCYNTNSFLFHRPVGRCHTGTPWSSAARAAAMVASVSVH
ncbi:hypothetical protein ACFSJ3_12515 [Corallincola platygyrae]|uniref:Cell division inhibitor SulA n=1 Tax=Corallincola platygyrae TaxID=1193278 RepID=A0ABW4XPA7_9GAMM